MMRKWRQSCFLLWSNGILNLSLGDVTYDSEKVRQTAEQSGIILISPINRRNSEKQKDTYGRVLPVFLKTRFGQWVFGLRREIERVFNELKSDGLEPPRWYVFHRYVLHVLCCSITSSFYSSFATPSYKISSDQVIMYCNM
jgi:hypothetical protein